MENLLVKTKLLLLDIIFLFCSFITSCRNAAVIFMNK
jgi:hypothetical protein